MSLREDLEGAKVVRNHTTCEAGGMGRPRRCRRAKLRGTRSGLDVRLRNATMQPAIDKYIPVANRKAAFRLITW